MRHSKVTITGMALAGAVAICLGTATRTIGQQPPPPAGGPGGGPGAQGQFGRPGGPGRGPGGVGGQRRGIGPRPGEILPEMLQNQLKLSDDQKIQLAILQKEVNTKLAKILTATQNKQLEAMKNRGPGGFGGPGRGFGRPGGGPAGPGPGGPGAPGGPGPGIPPRAGGPGGGPQQ